MRPRLFGSHTQVTGMIVWTAVVFYFLGRAPQPPADFPDQRAGAARAGYNPELAAALDANLRDYWQKPDQVLDSLGDLTGLKVADIGCGEGYFTRRLLERVGPTGHVYAGDIRADVLETLAASLTEEQRARTSLILSDGSDTGIKETVDLVLVVQVLGEVEEQGPFIEGLLRIMDAGSRLVLIDSKHITDPNQGFTRPMNTAKLRAGLAQYGLVPHPDYPAEGFDFLPKQFFFVFHKRPPVEEG